MTTTEAIRLLMDVTRTACAVLMVVILAYSACVQTAQVRVPTSQAER